MIHFFRIAFYCLIASSVIAQTVGDRHYFDFQNANGDVLKYALAGGLTAPQFSAGDLNNDGILDLYIFDKVGDVHLTFINKGTPSQEDYEYAPEYETAFPNVEDWAMLRDYNGDNIPDLFASGTRLGASGIEVFKGAYENNKLTFIPIKNWRYSFDVLSYLSNSGSQLNVYVTGQDIPSLDDIDNDGDLDVVTFNISGSAMDFYRNMAVENGFSLDSLYFELDDICWGRFHESGFSSEIELSTHIDTCAVSGIYVGRGAVHSGSTSVTLDIDGDMDREVLLGDISSNAMTLLKNTNNDQKAFFTSQENDFPSDDVPVDIFIFPAGYYLDLNNDDKKDLIFAPNETIGEDDAVCWYYKDVSTNNIADFNYEQSDFLVGDMIDLGSGAYPTIFDYNADGLLDLLIGNFGYFETTGYDVRLTLYKNIGTASNPIFRLEEEDYLNFSQYATRNLMPSVGDLDGDEDLDLIVGDEAGILYYVENMGGKDNPVDFGSIIYKYKDIDVGQHSAPIIYDADGDGLSDLIVGEKNGNLNFFKNIGSLGNPDFEMNPDFEPNNSFWGQVDTRVPGFVIGYSSPTIVVVDEIPQLLVGSNRGVILQYDGLENDVFNKKDERYGNIDVGKESSVALADLNKNGFLDMVVGNFRGGISIYQTNLDSGEDPISTTTPQNGISTIKIYPNPATNIFVVESEDVSETFSVELYDLLGRNLIYKEAQHKTIIDVASMATGVYLCKVNGQGYTYNKKIVIK